MSGMNVLLVSGAGYVSGKEIMSLELARGLVQTGHRVTLLTSYWNDGDFIARLNAEGLAFHVLPIGFISATLTPECMRMTGEQLLRWPGLLWGYARLLRRERPARVVHTNWHHLLLLLPFLRPQRDLFWLHEIVPNLPRYGRLFRLFERRLHCFVCVSHAVGRSLRALGVREESIVVIHNGIVDPAPAGRVVSAAARDGALAPVRIGIVGQVGPWKGHEDLLEALGLLREWGLAFTLDIVGLGAERFTSELKRRAEQLGLSSDVRWRGFVRDREEIYGVLDICVVPSRSEEPFATTAFEPAFFGLPVVATRRGGLPEIVEDRQTGLLVNSEDPESLATALRELIVNPACRAEMGTRARKRALERFGAARFAAEFSALLETT